MAGHHLLASIQVNFCFWSSDKIWYMKLLPYNCPSVLWRVGQKLLSKDEFMRYSISFGNISLHCSILEKWKRRKQAREKNSKRDSRIGGVFLNTFLVFSNRLMDTKSHQLNSPAAWLSASMVTFRIWPCILDFLLTYELLPTPDREKEGKN